MATVIDALIVELNLDASKFNAQQQAAIDRAKRGTDQLKRTAGDTEKSASDAIGSITSLSVKAFGAVAALVGVRGFGDFLQTTIHTGSALGRLSRAIGVSAQEISKWQGAAREFGSTGEAMAASAQQLSNVFTAWKVGGPEAPGVMQIFAAINREAQHLDANNAAAIDSSKSLNENYIALGKNLKIIHDLSRDKNYASYLAQKIPGMDAGMIDLLTSGKLEQTLAKVVGWTDAEAEATGRVQRRWDGAKVSVENYLKTKIFQVADFLNTPVSDFFTDHPTHQSMLKPSVNSESVAGGFTSPRQKEAFIRAEAARRGIDPDLAMSVARSEGFNNPVGDNGTSLGAFQLHVTPGGRGKAVGDLFRERTGMDPADPKNEAAGIQFALDWAKQNGWHDFHGAANGAHLSNWAGIDRSGGTGSVTNHMEINGPVTIQ